MTQIQNFLLLHLPLTIFALILFSVPNVSAEQYHALVAPLTKDTHTSLFSLTLKPNENYVIDLESPFLWYNCPKYYPAVASGTAECLATQAHFSPLCSSQIDPAPNSLTCPVTPVNPVTQTCSLAELTYKALVISWTNGLNPTININFTHSYVSCAPDFLLESLPIGSSGMAGLSRELLALPTQFSPFFLYFKRQFSICLPSIHRVPGVIFFGEGPFYLSPSWASTKFDVTSILSYTPLLNHSTNLGYYIGLTGISIHSKMQQFQSPKIEFDSLSQHGAKISTIVPYTTLISPIYRAFLRQFKSATRGIPRARKVKPFDLCFDTSKLGSIRTRLRFPQIDFEVADGKNWTIFGSNSMKEVSRNVACLAFVDGGENADEAVVIGSFQMENNFLLFDLVESRLGFSSSLLNVGTTCSNFNFTSVGQV
ncbi:Peptidase A1 [Macleaya cordata]|uniref:Peptidase A1 n=1 Tax=Macleaya cordata TaxID=56857 RepID=A0A200PXJ6_MACCD|nr:Peptidase A1 [Macleaya cordata]